MWHHSGRSVGSVGSAINTSRPQTKRPQYALRPWVRPASNHSDEICTIVRDIPDCRSVERSQQSRSEPVWPRSGPVHDKLRRCQDVKCNLGVRMYAGLIWTHSGMHLAPPKGAPNGSEWARWLHHGHVHRDRSGGRGPVGGWR